VGLATPRHTHGVENGKQQGKVKTVKGSEWLLIKLTRFACYFASF
jgi:hypothetical protein